MHYQHDYLESMTPRTDAAWVDAKKGAGRKNGSVRAARMRDFATKLEYELLELKVKCERLREEKALL